MTHRSLSPRILGCLVEAIHRVEELWGNAPTTRTSSIRPCGSESVSISIFMRLSKS